MQLMRILFLVMLGVSAQSHAMSRLLRGAQVSAQRGALLKLPVGSIQKRTFMAESTVLAIKTVGGLAGAGAGRIFDDYDEIKCSVIGGLFGFLLFSIFTDETEADVKKDLDWKVEFCDKKLQTFARYEDAQLVQAVNQYYVAQHTPLIAAFNRYSDDRDRLQRARELADKLANGVGDEEIEKKSNYASMSLQFQEQLKHTERALNIIKNQPEFMAQLNAANGRRAADAAQLNATANSINAAANTVSAIVGTNSK
jgi:hypothetical protein